MFTNVLVGVDDLQLGHDPIILAKTLLAPSGRLTLAHVLTSEPYVFRGAAGRYAAEDWARPAELQEQERALALLERARDEARLSQHGVELTLRCLRSPLVGRGLRELAETVRADLLVLGSSRQSLLGQAVIRDDTRAALTGAPCAVAIAPAGYSEQPRVMREIGVGYDGSAESEHAVDVARELAAEWGAKLSAFTALSVPTSAFGPGHRPLTDAINDLVSQARHRIAALGGVEPHAAYGTAAEELAIYSASLDLLIIGSRAYGPIGRLIHGSTSARLARTARCALLVLPRARGRRDGEHRHAVGMARHDAPLLEPRSDGMSHCGVPEGFLSVGD
jgi:nucleotide-binding universal stress UspA family protein